MCERSVVMDGICPTHVHSIAQVHVACDDMFLCYLLQVVLFTWRPATRPALVLGYHPRWEEIHVEVLAIVGLMCICSEFVNPKMFT